MVQGDKGNSDMSAAEKLVLHGRSVNIRPILMSDAEYVFSLRTNPSLNKHLSTAPASVSAQEKWIEAYKHREKLGQEYYFIVERVDGIRCGVVRVYDVAEDQFTWGSWILDENKPPKAALDCAILVYRFGFRSLGLSRAVFDVRVDNQRTLAFHDRFGAVRTGSDAHNVYYKLERGSYEAAEGNHLRSLA